MALPARDTSLPMPAMVLHPASTKPNTTKAVNTIFPRMLELLIK